MSITGNGQSIAITDASLQVDLGCLCKSKSFNVVVIPLKIRPGAAITKLQCCKCRLVYVVSDVGVVGDKSHLWKDAQHRKHHTMKAEPGIYKIHK